MITLLYRRNDGSFVAEINGLPYHVTEEDPLFEAVQEVANEMGDNLSFEPAPPDQEPITPNEISDRQFFHILAIDGLIAEEEALAAVKTGESPAAFNTLINSLPLADQFNARMLLEGATTFKRNHPLTNAFGAMYGMTSEQIDSLWQRASVL